MPENIFISMHTTVSFRQRLFTQLVESPVLSESGTVLINIYFNDRHLINTGQCFHYYLLFFLQIFPIYNHNGVGVVK